ncbi:MAG: transcription termination/antitermination protein NusG [Synergistaceae bacterium]|jgi:transcriptional antiterminator NusG|nr:transcription termination/antitermination protein NusG [Synergistaceae bacterium]
MSEETFEMEEQAERRWYVVQTYSGYENRVKANLEQRIATMGMEDSIFSVLIPMEERVSVKDGKSRKVARKLYPSYVLVEMLLGEQSWYVVRHTPGVTGFVGSGSYPLPLSEKEMREIMNRAGSPGKEQHKPRVEINLKPGDTVRVKSGPLEGHAGPVVRVLPDKGEGKVVFTVSVFGRETEAEADYTSLEKI